MKTTGFMKGTDHALPDGPDIAEMSGTLRIDQNDKATVVRYLSEAPTAVRSLGTINYDVLDEGRPEIGPHEILTDGQWAWPNDLGYYVDKYNMGVDSDFVAHILKVQTPPSSVSDEIVREVERTLFGA